MRVVILSKTFIADAAQRQLEWIARQPGIALTLVAPSEWRGDDGRVVQFVSRYSEGYTICLTPVRCNGHYHLYTYRDLEAIARLFHPDVLHVDEEPYNPASAQAQRIATRLGIPTIFVAWQNIDRAYPPPHVWFERFVYQHAAAIIAGSAAAASVLHAKGYRGRLATFPVHGVDPTLFAPWRRAPGDGTIVIGYVGRLVRAKGLGVLLAAFAGLPPPHRLRLVGSGPDERYLRALATAYGIATRVEFLPGVPASVVPRVLNGMDMLVLPSLTCPTWKEQFGRVLIEAMACGVPVVGSSSGEIPEVIGDAGLVVPEGDVRSLRAALRALARQPDLRQQMGARGRQRVLERFTYEHVARQLAELYTRVRATDHAALASIPDDPPGAAQDVRARVAGNERPRGQPHGQA